MAFAKDLRASVLQTAMQGKLTEQLETDTPVSELLDQISLKTKKRITSVEDDELPDGWHSVKITDVVTLYTGNSISENVKAAKYCGLKDGYDYIGTKDVNFDHTICYDNGVRIPFNEPNFRYAEKDATLLCIEGGSAGRKIAILDKKVCFGNKLCAFHPIDIESKFLYFFLQSPQFLGVFTNNISGIIGGVSINKIKQMTLPIPPIEEQKRIVRRVDEIMTLIDELEAIEEELTKLKKAFPGDMKNAILQAAMQGKLTKQLDTDGSVDELLDNIKAEREKLVKEGKIKKAKAQNDNFVALEDVPFDIPSSWEWVLLSDIVKKNIKRGKSPSYSENGKVLVFAQKCNTKTHGIDLSLSQHLDDSCIIKYPTEEFMQDMDIVINSTGTGTLGRVGIYRDTNNPEKHPIVPDSHVTIIRTQEPVSTKYIYYVLTYYQPYMEKLSTGSTNQKELGVSTISNLIVPLPPIEEQQRIVDKLETILPLIENI